ncbi:hypothetical protein CCR75_003630 [Bremia lactucae]|uniref:polynucleotide adenylyltransferase n=1 Tax=Bremia lactucae TaxID=4779 RepID=A0A976ILH3_BRELC|nr:hypothetical protein CCR75_003630 [Bremia lactucae]
MILPDNRDQHGLISSGVRSFSFKDAVVGSKNDLAMSAKPLAPASRPIRSRSITKLVSRSSFKKRCEALQSPNGRCQLNLKDQALAPCRSVMTEKGETMTRVQELCTQERRTDSATETGKDRVNRLPSSSSTADRDDGTLVTPSSCDSSPMKALRHERIGLDEKTRGESMGLDKKVLPCNLAVTCTRAKKSVDSDDDFFDCDDTNSESTVESSCPSPHRSSPLSSNSYSSRLEHEMETYEDDECLQRLLHGRDEDDEAYMLLDRINNLSEEFIAHREYEESTAMLWAVQQAAQQGILSVSLQQNLCANIREGYLDEARDVLYHKCHLIPAVASVVESPFQPSMDLRAVQSFGAYINTISPMDLPEARVRKLHVLKQLSDLLTKWVKMVGRERELSEAHIALTKGSLFLAGSYRLGLDDPNSDIDIVCVTPWHVTHDDFFGSFCQLLQHTPGVSQLAPVPHAYVPLISLSFLTVRMDLLFARLPVSRVEANQNIDSDHMLIGVHESSMKALNAPRVSSMLLCLVPKRREYRIVLRAVRAWARRRGIYSAKLGYLGGISWAILVAFTCQLYPDAAPATIFVRFFQVFSEWQWPQPVMLNIIYDAGLGFDMWDPVQNVFDRSHIMPIITPAYPHMNSSVQVSQSTYSVIYEELWRARYLAEIAVGISKPISSAALVRNSSETDITPAVVCMTTSVPSCDSTFRTQEAIDDKNAWDELFQRSNFFIRYGSYLVFNFKADSENAMLKWGKFVQSRLRKLVDNLQHMSPVSRVHALPCYYSQTSDSEGHGFGSCMFIGIEFYCFEQDGIPPKDDPEVKTTLEQTIRFFLATDLQQMEDKQSDMTAEAKILSWDELPEFVFPSGRKSAEIERAQFTTNLQKMGFTFGNTSLFQPFCDVNRCTSSGKWRGGYGPRKYTGGPRKQRRDYQNAQQSQGG